jgi:Na+-driven multidrug efflux pump
MLQRFLGAILAGAVIGFLTGVARAWDKADRPASVRIALRHGLWGAVVGLIIGLGMIAIHGNE